LAATSHDHASFASRDSPARYWWLVLIRALAAILFGVLALFWPAAAILSFLLMFAAYLVIDGAFAMTAGVRAIDRHERWGFFIAEGVFDLVLAAAIVIFPGAAVFGFVWFTAIWAVATGVSMIAAAWHMERAHGRWWLVLGGVLSVIWGAFLVFLPLLGATILIWSFAAYAILFGLLLLAAAFRLWRSHGAEHA
jgi:uncharacterized membrane protein HdeD (DUF308 family)